MIRADHGERRLADRPRNGGGPCKEEALQQIDAEREDRFDLLGRFQPLCHDLHPTLVRVRDRVRHDLALVGVGVDVTDDGEVDFDVVG